MNGIKAFIFAVLVSFTRKWSTYHKLKTALGLIAENGAPVICEVCGHDKFNHVTTAMLEHTEAEFDLVCKKCNTVAGSWAYGCWIV